MKKSGFGEEQIIKVLKELNSGKLSKRRIEKSNTR